MVAEGGYDERDPLMEHTDDCDNDDEGNETTGFDPGASSTPVPNGNQRRTMMNRPGQHQPEQPSWVELPEIPGSLASTTFTAANELHK